MSGDDLLPWRCCGCGCNPPFDCQCATDVAWQKNAEGKNIGLSKSEYRRGLGLPARFIADGGSNE